MIKYIEHIIDSYDPIRQRELLDDQADGHEVD